MQEADGAGLDGALAPVALLVVAAAGAALAHTRPTLRALLRGRSNKQGATGGEASGAIVDRFSPGSLPGPPRRANVTRTGSGLGGASLSRMMYVREPLPGLVACSLSFLYDSSSSALRFG